MKRTPEEWRNIIKLQPASGLTVDEFCKQHKISKSCFYQHRKVLNSAFVPAKIVSHSPVESPQSTSHTHLTLKLACGLLTLPENTSPRYLVELIKGLSV